MSLPMLRLCYAVCMIQQEQTLNVKSCEAICQKEHQVLLPIFGTCTLTVEEHQFLISQSHFTPFIPISSQFTLQECDL